MGDIDIVCESNNIEDWQQIKGDRTIIKFSSRKKSSEVLNKKKKLENSDIGKYGFNDGSRIYINESLRPYYSELWGKCKSIWQDQDRASFYRINGILRVKKSKHEKPIAITHDEDLLQLSEQK